MHCQRVILIALTASLGTTLGCGGDDSRAGAAWTADSGSADIAGASNADIAGASNTGSNSSSGGSSVALAGSAGAPPTATNIALSSGGGGTAGSTSTETSSGGTTEQDSVCGNGIRETAEACDGDDLYGYDCADMGYQAGILACNDDCSMDTSACTGQEQCTDGRDNDGDRLIDCEDSDCAGACSASCADPVVATDDATVHGALAGHATELVPLCSGTGEEPELVYAVTATRTGTLRASIFSSEEKLVSVRRGCDDPSTEFNCTRLSVVDVPVEAGETYFVVVEGGVTDTLGEFDLTFSSWEVACGNAERENAEECDDGNTRDGDGCSSNCTVEATEVESNRGPHRANPYVSPFYGAISSERDRDYVSFETAEPPGAIYVSTRDFGDGACSTGKLDSVLTLFDHDGSTILAEDDDGGYGYCSAIEYVPESPEEGTYFVAVGASPLGLSSEFPYVLDITVELCGNGIGSGDEACDDGNRESGDGCSATCQLEE